MRPRPTLLTLTAILALLCAVGAPASAATTTEAGNPIQDQGSSYHYRSSVTAIVPRIPGLSVQVLEFADRLLLINHTGKTITIFGYNGEPYARVLANGTTEQNENAPATYLNTSFYGDVNPPAGATPGAKPRWTVIDRTGQFEWHDHRIHYMSPAIPPVVKNQSRRTLVFDWKVPIAVGSQRATIDGSLYWTPEGSKASVAVIVIGVAIALGGLALVLVVRRRRSRTSGAPPRGGEGSAREAW